MVNNHGDPKSPKDRVGVVGPLPNGRTSWLVNGGDPTRPGMILQVDFEPPPRSAEFDVQRLGLVGLVFLVDGFEDSKTNLS